MKKNKFDCSGSALVWVLVICLIFGILGMAIGWVALSMNNRSVKNNVLNQNYFSSRSAVDTIFSRLNGFSNNDDKKLYDDLYKNLVNGEQKIQIDNVFEDVPEMSNCTVNGEYTKGMVKLTATTEKGNEKDNVTLWAKRKIIGEEWPSEAWASPLPKATGTGGSAQIIIGTKNSVTNEDAENKDIDVAVYTLGDDKEAETKIEGKLTIGKYLDDGKNISEKKAVFIYIKKNAILTMKGMDYVLPSYNTDALKNGPAIGTDRWFVHENYTYFDKNTGKGKNSYTKSNWENWDYYYGPDIFIYVENGGKLIFNSPNRNMSNKEEITPFPFYIYGEAGSIIDINGTLDVPVYYCQGEFNYGDNAKKANLKLEYETKNNAPVRLPLSGYAQAGKISKENGLYIDQWEIYQYDEEGAS